MPGKEVGKMAITSIVQTLLNQDLVYLKRYHLKILKAHICARTHNYTRAQSTTHGAQVTVSVCFPFYNLQDEAKQFGAAEARRRKDER